jgi:hypothetical protein
LSFSSIDRKSKDGWVLLGAIDLQQNNNAKKLRQNIHDD